MAAGETIVFPPIQGALVPVFTFNTATKRLGIRFFEQGLPADIGTYDDTAGLFFITKVMSVRAGGNTNASSSGSGTDFDHDLTVSIPANFMIKNRVFRISAHYRLTTGSAPPLLTHKVKVGAVTLGSSTALNVGVNMTNVQYGVQWTFQATQDPGATSTVECMATCGLDGVGPTGVVHTAMPVVVATNSVQDVKVSTRWDSVGTGTTTIGLSQFLVENLN